MPTRSRFLRRTALAGAATLAVRPFAAPAAAPPPPVALVDDRLGAALVLSGGGATGAYEAGVVAALVAAAGVRDGQPIPDVDIVVGTSIGSLNGWLVATGQYALLANVWHEIAAQRLLALQPHYEPIVQPSSGIATRVVAALELERGVVTNVTGILDRERVAAFVAKLVDPTIVPLVPIVFTATNLSRERAEIFFRTSEPLSPAARANGEHRLRSVVGARTAIHEATPELLRPALLASTAIPALFSPVEMTFDGGEPDQLVDGGIADNTPVDVARTLARNVRTVIVDPKEIGHRTFPNAAAIIAESLGLAERRSLEKSLRAAKLESEGARLFAGTATTPEQLAFLANVFPAELTIVQPRTRLALDFQNFEDQRGIDDAYARGLADGAAGFVPYELPIPGS